MRVLVAGFTTFLLLIIHASWSPDITQPAPQPQKHAQGTILPPAPPGLLPPTIIGTQNARIVHAIRVAGTAPEPTGPPVTVPPPEPVVPVPVGEVREPAPAPDPCRSVVNNRWTRLDTVMRWCGTVAAHLTRYNWQPYDLSTLMSLLGCESSGRPMANEQNWGTGPRAVFGLFSHRRQYWDARVAAAGHAHLPKYDAEQHADIAVGVWLFKANGGVGHWTGCWNAVKREGNLPASVIRRLDR